LFAFTGKQFDDATGLQHNLFRWLDPSLGQWLNDDPIGFVAGDENVRRYVRNGVVDSIDPSGLQEPWLYPRMPMGERCTGSWPPRDPPDLRWPAIFPSRPLTPGEVDLLQCIFQGHLNTDGLVVIEGTFPFSQGGNTVTPRYTAWFPPANYAGDFSQVSDWRYGHFIHEMTHVLQSQQGNWNQTDFLYLFLANGFTYESTYIFDFERLGQPLHTFSFEQQADIIKMYFTNAPALATPIDYRERAWLTIQGFQTQPPPLPPIAWPIYAPGSNPNPFTP
jgi:RHS repeat-associated protein